MKVADFGLSEDVYTTGYFRQGKDDHVKLPFKWMAPESMIDSIFNEKTDVVRTHLHNNIMLVTSHDWFCSGRLELLVGRFSVLGRPLTQEFLLPICQNYSKKGITSQCC